MWQPEFHLHRHCLALLNHIGTIQGHYAFCQKKWGLAATDVPLWQTPNDVTYCRQLPTDQGGLQRLHSADDVAIEWLKTYGSNALITRTSNAFENWTSQVYYTEHPLLFTNFSICTVYLLTAQTLLDERNKTVVLQNVLTICYTHPVLILRHNQSLALLLKFWLPVWDFHQDWLPVFGVSK